MKERVVKNKLYKYSFWSIFVAVFVFLSVGFVISQSTQMPWNTPTGSVWHDSSEVYCDGCVGTENIKDLSMTDADVSLSANINPFKVSGVNGVFDQSISFVPGSPSQVTIVSSALPSTGWVGKRIEVICEPGVSPTISIKSGVSSITSTTQYTTEKNYYSVFIPSVGSGINLGGTLGSGWTKVYELANWNVGSSTPIGKRELFIRVDPASSNQLQMAQTNSGGPSFTTPWNCIFKFGAV